MHTFTCTRLLARSSADRRCARLTAHALWLAVCAAGPCKFEVHEEDLQFEPLKTEWDALPEGDRAKSVPCFLTANRHMYIGVMGN